MYFNNTINYYTMHIKIVVPFDDVMILPPLWPSQRSCKNLKRSFVNSSFCSTLEPWGVGDEGEGHFQTRSQHTGSFNMSSLTCHQHVINIWNSPLAPGTLDRPASTETGCWAAGEVWCSPHLGSPGTSSTDLTENASKVIWWLLWDTRTFQ